MGKAASVLEGLRQNFHGSVVYTKRILKFRQTFISCTCLDGLFSIYPRSFWTWEILVLQDVLFRKTCLLHGHWLQPLLLYQHDHLLNLFDCLQQLRLLASPPVDQPRPLE